MMEAVVQIIKIKPDNSLLHRTGKDQGQIRRNYICARIDLPGSHDDDFATSTSLEEDIVVNLKFCYNFFLTLIHFTTFGSFILAPHVENHRELHTHV